VEESSEQINNNSEAGCGDASCGTSPLVADASSIIDMTKTPPTGKSTTQNENKKKSKRSPKSQVQRKYKKKFLLNELRRIADHAHQYPTVGYTVQSDHPQKINFFQPFRHKPTNCPQSGTSG